MYKNNNPFKFPRQVFFNKFSKLSYRHCEFVRSLNFKQRRLLNVIIGLSNRYESVHCSQSWLSEICIYSREHVSRLLKEFEEYGFIVTIQRMNTSKLYFVNPQLWCRDIKDKLQHYLPALRTVTFALVMAAMSLFGKSHKKGHITLSIQGIKDLSKSIKYLDSYYPGRGALYGLVDDYWRGKRSIRGLAMQSDHPLFDVDFLTEGIKRATTTLNLSRAGQIIMSAYPDDAIEFMLSRFQIHNYRVRKPFQWAVKVLEDYCIAREIKPDHARKIALQGFYNLSPESITQLPSSSVEADLITITPKNQPFMHTPKPLAKATASTPTTGMKGTSFSDGSICDIIEKRDWEGKRYSIQTPRATTTQQWERDEADSFRKSQREKYARLAEVKQPKTNKFRSIGEVLDRRSDNDRGDDKVGSWDEFRLEQGQPTEEIYLEGGTEGFEIF